MQPYVYLKIVHIVAAMIFFGTGLGSAWYKMQADRSDRIEVVLWCQRAIVTADWWFTIPSAVVLPLSGLWMADMLNVPWTRDWVLAGLIGYAVAGIFWLPAAYLQIRMRALAEQAYELGEPLPPAFHRHRRTWLLLGIPSFSAAMFTIFVMVAKRLPF